MSSQIKRSKKEAKPVDWLKPHRARFLRGLSDEGYSGATLRSYDHVASSFCRAVEMQGLDQADLAGEKIAQIRAEALDSLTPSLRARAKFCLNRFIDALVEAGVVQLSEPPRKAPTALHRLCEEYEAYLRDQRGLSKATIYQCVRFLDRFMAFRFGEEVGCLDDIMPGDIVAFLRKIRGRDKPYRDKTPPTHLRALFRFLFWSGKTKRDLASSIPRIAKHRDANLPRSLKPEDIQRLIDAVWSNNTVGRRNYAMMLALARLGLRGPEVIAIQLDDIDWRAGTILIRGKGKLHDRMPLPDEVGKAIVDYIRNGRRGPSRTLFVSNKVPFRPFVDAQILNMVLREAFDRTGLKPPQKYVGSHLLRHSLATDMLRKGSSLDEIGDVLRHRSRATTMIYAKHDVEGLRSIAQAWPGQGDRA